jgi:hypothetical protein
MALQNPIAQPKAPWDPFGSGAQLRVSGLRQSIAGFPIAGLTEEMLAGDNDRVRVLISAGGNPIAA